MWKTLRIGNWTYQWLVGKYLQESERKKNSSTFLRMLLSSIADENDRWNEYNETKAALVNFCDKTSEVAANQLKVDHIKDH